MTVDFDSTIWEVSGKAKAGASYGYTSVLGYHPLSAFRADTGEVVGARLREGASQRGVVHFAKETIRRARRAGAKSPINVRADSGFWSYAMLAALDQLGVGWSVTVPQNAKVRAIIAAIGQQAWTAIAYPDGGEAQVAETVLEMINSKKRSQRREVRLVVRRTRLVGPQPEFWKNWRHHAFVTNLDASPTDTYRHHTHTEENTHTGTGTGTEASRRLVESDRYHRRHAVCELAIRDLKGSGGLAHLPSGVFNANAAWLLCAALAHNLYRQIAILGQTQPSAQLVCGRTIRTRLFGVPGRLVNHGGRPILRLPARWPWATAYQTTLANLRGLPQLC
ncbi:MAG: IS1380 family transposase [bacterium]|nr:IS1380 family transposase [bacterium]